MVPAPRDATQLTRTDQKQTTKLKTFGGVVDPKTSQTRIFMALWVVEKERKTLNSLSTKFGRLENSATKIR